MEPLDDLLDAHLNVSWLRPDNVVWDATASYRIREARSFVRPVLDLGSGNGIFSFVTAGGRFGIDFDWFVQVDVARADGDMYEARAKECPPTIAKVPEYRIDVALDQKRRLLEQAALLGLYDEFVEHDANYPLPFPDEQFATVFSNILYWLEDPEKVLGECARILGRGGRGLFCVPDPSFYMVCESYRWREFGSEWLRLLNGQRDVCIRWTATPAEFDQMAAAAGLRVIGHHPYLGRRTLLLWDTAMRPVLRPLIRMVNGLMPARRAAIKAEWITALRPPLRALLYEELEAVPDGGFHLFVVEKP